MGQTFPLPKISSRNNEQDIQNYSIVGKGNHSTNHIQKLKPRVEQVCRELRLQYTTEDNEGRIYVNLTGGKADMPPPSQPSHPHQRPAQPHHGGQQQQKDGELVPKLLRKLEKACCIVM